MSLKVLGRYAVGAYGFFLLAYCFLPLSLFASSKDTLSSSYHERTLSRETLEKFLEDEDFIYDRGPKGEAESVYERFRLWIRDLIQKLFGDDFQGFGGGVAGFLVDFLQIVLIVGVLAIVVLQLLGVRAGGIFRKKGESPAFRVNEHDDHKGSGTSLRESLQKARDNREWKRALRLYFLILLEELGQKGVLDLRAEKTNADYLGEIRDDQLRSDFQKFSRLYEVVCYGDRPLPSTQFERWASSFERFIQDIKGRNVQGK